MANNDKRTLAANSTKSAKGPGRPFAPGVSGNPEGRPKIPEHVREMARAHTEEAIAALKDCLKSANESVRVSAANSILDRAWGKPQQAIEVSTATPIGPQVLEQAQAWLNRPELAAHVLALAEAGAVVSEEPS